MPYILRNQDSHIIAVLSEPVEGAQQVSCHDAELEVFLRLESPERLAAKALHESDNDMIRVLEDLIDIMIERGTMKFTDFPERAQYKLLSRRNIRAGFLSVDETITSQSMDLDEDSGPDRFL